MKKTPLTLTVDDDHQINLGMQLRIRAAGYESIDAGDGLEGLELAISLQPDLIIADIRMPNLDGISMLKKLKEHPRTSSIPVIMVSANIAEKTRIEAKQYGAYCFLEKPYASSMFMQAIQSALEIGDAASQTTGSNL